MTAKVDAKADRSKTAPIPTWAYLDGAIVPYREARFGLLTHALNYGTGLFAGVRAYWNEEERQLFVLIEETMPAQPLAALAAALQQAERDGA